MDRGRSVLPERIRRHAGPDIRIVECDEEYDGAFVVERNEIRIRKDLEPLRKQAVLLHEMLHIASSDAKAEGDIERELPEKVVEAVGWRLFLMLGLSGLWADVVLGKRPQEAKEAST